MWRYWSLSQLQGEMEPESLDFISKVLGVLDPESAATFLGNKIRLARLVEGMQEHSYFRRPGRLITSLERLPSEVLARAHNALDLEVPLDNVTPDSLAKVVRGNDANLRKLLTFFGLNERFLYRNEREPERITRNIAATSQTPKIVLKPFKTLKDYQVRCALDAEEYLKAPHGRVLLQMPTGSGKTRTAMEIIANHLNNDSSSQVVWLANTRELCEQAVQCFIEVWDHVGKHDCDVIRFWGKGVSGIEDWSCSNKSFTVAGLQSAWDLLRGHRERFLNCFDNTSLLVVDEAHIAVAPTYLEVIKEIAHLSSAKILGLTATPARSSREESGVLASTFFEAIVGLESSFRARDGAIAFLRNEGVLSRVKFTPLRNDSYSSLAEKRIEKLAGDSDYTDAFLKDLGKDSYRTVVMLREVLGRLKDGKRVIIFCPSVKNSFLVSSILTFLGFRSAHISGSTAVATRDALIRQFVGGELQVLCNYGVLSTGFDAPKVDTVVIARPTRSAVLYSQMIGRGMRGPAVGGTEECEILEVMDVFLNQSDQDMLYEEFREYWDP